MWVAGLIVHEWAERAGGAEQVVDQFRLEFPDADIQMLWNDALDRFPTARESWMARTPLRRHKAVALPLMPFAWRGLRAPKEYEWLLVSSHLFAHHAQLRREPQPPKMVYAHTPARYIWEPDIDVRGQRLPVRLASGLLKPLDRKRAQEPIAIAANSQFTRARIRSSWGRDAEVIYPPVDTDSISEVQDWRVRLGSEELYQLQRLPELFLLGASRFVKYKRLEIVIRAGEAAGIPVVIAGSGPDESRLRQLAQVASVPVHFVPSPTTAMLRALYQSAQLFVFPAIEDFGIMPVEAIACGTPVVVPSTGGAAETVEATDGGALFEEDTMTELRVAVEAGLATDRSRLRQAASGFSNARFRSEIREWVESRGEQ